MNEIILRDGCKLLRDYFTAFIITASSAQCTQAGPLVAKQYKASKGEIDYVRGACTSTTSE